jgi:probable phosphoglycerate mutase
LLFKDGCPGGEDAEHVGARVDWLIARVGAVGGHVALFGHGHIFRVFAARWLGLPAAAGCHFSLDPATLSILGYYRGIPALKQWNAPLAWHPGSADQAATVASWVAPPAGRGTG